MKVNIFMVLLALMIGALSFYGYYTSGVEVFEAIIGTLFPTSFLVVSMGLSLRDYPRSSALLKGTSLIIYIILFILNIILVVTSVSEGLFVTLNGVFMVFSVMLLYLLTRSEQ